MMQSRPIRYRKMADEVAGTLRDMIVLGELAPGQRATQDELAEMLGVSPTPVREALLKLAANGLIEASPNRYFRVARTTPEDVRDTYWIHAVLSAELTRRACTRQTPELISNLRELEDGYRAAVEANDAAGMATSNWDLHRLVNTAAESPRLRFLLKATLRFIPDNVYAEIDNWGATSIAGHRAIVAAFEAQDADAAAAAATSHVLVGGEQLLNRLMERGLWDGNLPPEPDPEPRGRRKPASRRVRAADERPPA